jgi:tRNA A-37 threonylcarbamoyl transferase component Bud32
MSFFWINKEYKSSLERLGWLSSEEIVKFFTDNQKLLPVFIKEAVLKISQENLLTVFYKQYHYAKPSWKFALRASKARCEFRNYSEFQKLGIPSARPVVCGEQRDYFGRLSTAFIITQAIPHATDLVTFFTQYLADRKDAATRRLRREVLHALAKMTRRLHCADFFHHDLVWRNILVTWDNNGPALWWIDCPRGQYDRWSPLRYRRRIKDLASLDKSAMQFCTRGERLAFVQCYLDKQRATAEVRQLVHATLTYGKRRWPNG